jgi:radical SAM superfamily enzyme YgiQ (UPF0313 family)
LRDCEVVPPSQKDLSMPRALINAHVDFEKMMFSRAHCFRYDGSLQEHRCLLALFGYLAKKRMNLALFGAGRLCRYFLDNMPPLKRIISIILDHDKNLHGKEIEGIRIIAPEDIPHHVKTVFLCTTHWRSISRMRKSLPANLQIVTLDDLRDIDWRIIPLRAWVPKVESIYPIEIPEIEFLPNQDVILLDFPARSLAQLPAGFGYVHDALKKEGIKLQTVDLDIIIYHRYHSNRILDGLLAYKTPTGHTLPEDPWQPVHYLEWEKDDVISFFQSDIDEIVEKLIQARPKILACSLQQANLAFAKRVIREVRKSLPELIVIVGGMSCLHPGAAKFIFHEADYTVVGEADLIIGPLVKVLVKGEKPRDLPGVWSRYDSAGREFIPGPIPMHLDPLGHPRYEWTNVGLYRNWNGYQLTPIVGSRGCLWSRCRFCGERFKWRARSPERVVDDLEHFNKNGCVEFVFNESDLHGDPGIIERMCDEIIRRRLMVRMTAQLRCNGRVNRQYFRKLAKAGFVCLRFGVDAWSTNTLKLQRKGYTKDMIRNNLRDTTESGIFTETNIVVGVPGETEADVDEAINFIIELKPYIGRMAFINPLMLFRGSDYWDNPDTYGIRFCNDKNELYKTYPVAIPDRLWFSVDPYIDAEVRYKRYQRIAKTLVEEGIQTGNWADFTTEEIERKEIDLANTHNPATSANHGQSIIKNGNDACNRENIERIEEDTLVVESEGTMQGWFNKDAPVQNSGKLSMDNPFVMPSYRGYNLIRFGRYFYGCPTILGDIDFAKKEDHARPGIIVGENEIQVKNVIDDVLGSQEDEQSYLVFRFGDEFLGIPNTRDFLSIVNIKHEPKVGATSPRLIGSYKGYNLVSYDEFIYAVPLSLGPLDLTRQDAREKPGILVTLTESEARSLIDNKC